MKTTVTLQDYIKEGKITSKTLDRVKIAKSYIEKKYNLRKKEYEDKKKGKKKNIKKIYKKKLDWEQIKKKLNELDIPEEQKEELRQNFLHQEAEQMRQMRKKMSIREFEPLSIIGRGAFGEVRVCRQKETGSIVAVKKMRKEDMIKKNQLMHVRTEKEILTADNPWIVKLKYSFQDDYFLYLVMDYCPGGDLMNLLMKKDILTEDEARFYTAEMILAVDSVHKLNCIHRDLKPDNILIDKRGHVQLSDFGLSKLSDKTFFPISIKDNSTTFSILNNKEEITNHEPSKSSTPLETKKPLKKKNRLMAFSTVGTPDYIAPEVFGNDGYGQEVDWWSIGVMFFEMVVGYPPFFSENPSDTCKKIVKWKQYFQIPDDAELSNEAKSLIKKMVCSHENRLGVNGVDEIKKHPFFKGIDWDNLRNVKAPFIPDIENDWDNKYFDKFLEQESFYPPEEKKKKRKDVNYAGYTFNRDNENMKDGFVQALEILEVVKKSIKDKKGNNDDDDDEEKNNEKEKNKDKNNEEDKDKDKEDDKSIVDIILNDQDDDIEDEKEKKKENGNEEDEEEDDNEEEDTHQTAQSQPLLNKIGLNDNHKKSKSPETKNNNNNNKNIPLKIPIKSNRENKVSPGKNIKEKSPLFNKLKLNFDSSNKKQNPNKEHFKTVENKIQIKQQVESKNKKK